MGQWWWRGNSHNLYRPLILAAVLSISDSHRSHIYRPPGNALVKIMVITRVNHNQEQLSFAIVLITVLVCITMSTSASSRKVSLMYVCVCKAVTDSQVQSSVAAGVDSVRTISRCTGLGSECGKCVSFAHQRVKHHKSAQLGLATQVA